MRKRERKAPFITANDSVRTMMLDALIALLPALVWSIYTFGFRALKVAVASVAVSVVCDLVMSLIVHRKLGITDFSAIVTGLLFSCMLPYDVPVHVIAAGAAFAIVAAKGLFGGLGKNILNPAVCGRLFVQVAFGDALNTPTLSKGTAVLDTLRAGDIPEIHLVDMFMGDMGGAMGEISTLLLLAGGVYIILRGVADWRIPTSFIVGAAAVAYLICPHYDKLSWVLGQTFTGAFALAAFFLISDPVTSPVTPIGKLIYGAIGGALAIVCRMYLPFTDGVFVAVLAANALARPIDMLTKPKPFGSKTKIENKE